MQRVSQKTRYEFIHLLMKHATVNESTTEGDIQRVAQRLLRYGATLGRIALEDCNGPNVPNGLDAYNYRMLQNRWEEFMEREHAKAEQIRAKVETLCASIGCKPVFQGDPRGNTLKIQVPDGYANDWGREGICVPTS